TLLPLRDSPRPVAGDLLVSGTRIGGVGQVTPTPDTETVDISGCVVMPGLVQTHVHLVQTLFRGLAEDMPLLGWLRPRVWPLDAGGALTKRWHKASSGRIGYVYMPRFALSCTRELLEAVTQLAKLSDLLVHTHSNESVDERTAVTMATGRTPVQYLLDTGIASERTIIAHGVHLDDSEIEILKTTKTSVAHCPSSNLKLGSGIAQVARLRSARITVGLGADGAACNNRLDGFEEIRLATLLARVVSGIGTLSGYDAVGLATREGAKMLKIDTEVGTLEQGKRADLVVLDLEKLDGPGGDPVARILFGG